MGYIPTQGFLRPTAIHIMITSPRQRASSSTSAQLLILQEPTNQPTHFTKLCYHSLCLTFSPKNYFAFLPPTNFCTHLPTHLTSKYSTSTSDSYILTRQTKPNLLNTQTLFFYFSHLSYFLYLTSISTPYHHHM